jgi:hypothetical protein
VYSSNTSSFQLETIVKEMVSYSLWRFEKTDTPKVEQGRAQKSLASTTCQHRSFRSTILSLQSYNKVLPTYNDYCDATNECAKVLYQNIALEAGCTASSVYDIW